MASSLVVKLRNRLRAIWKLSLSVLRNDWSKRSLPRPGVRVPVEFASQQEVSEHSELAGDFVRRVLKLDWAFISDESSLWDFHTDPTNTALVARINQVYGVDVSDIQSAKLSEILERIATKQSSA
jgi:hypothetical protein